MVSRVSNVIRQYRYRRVVAHLRLHRNRYALASIVWTSIVVLLVIGNCLTESGASFGGWCGTCVAEARFSLYVVNPVLLFTSILATTLVRLLGTPLYRLSRRLTVATCAVVVAPICAMLVAQHIETFH